MGDEWRAMMLALDVDPMGGGDWRWRWYDHDSGRTLADGVEGGVVAAWKAATTQYVKSSNELLWSLDDRAEAAEQRAEAAEAEAERLRAELAAMPRPEDRCHGAWPCEASTALASAEVEAARWEARAEALATELAQARADALWLAVLWNGTNRNRTMSYMADDAVRQLHGSEQAVLTELWDRFEATNEDMVALLRRVLSAGNVVGA